MNQNFYNQIRNILLSARNKVYQTANFAMVEAYWNIGKSIIEEQGGNEKAEYGAGLLKELSKQMTHDFGKGFTVANLKNNSPAHPPKISRAEALVFIQFDFRAVPHAVF